MIIIKKIKINSSDINNIYGKIVIITIMITVILVIM